MLPLQLLHSSETPPSQAAPKIAALLNTISETQLRRWVEQIAIPRHFGAEPAQNRATADYIAAQFESFGLQVQRQGPYHNLIATSPENPIPAEAILVGAHYDSIPYCPGADDNASAVAVLKLITQPEPIGFGIETNARSLRRFRQEYAHAAKQREHSARAEKAQQILNSQNPDETFHLELKRRIQLSLLLSDTNDPNFAPQIQAGLTNLTKLQKLNP